MPAVGLVILFILPAILVLGFMLQDALVPEAWAALFDHPQFGKALALSLGSGATTTLAALIVSVFIATCLFQSGQLQKLQFALGAMLALPHLAFAVGVSFLIAPSGFIARLLAPLSGWAVPPAITTVHDPYAISLTVVLAAKETCFLLFALLQTLAREDKKQNLLAQVAAAQALGHENSSIASRVLVPQLWRDMIWPLVIVFVYATSVVDVAAVLGPSQPPTLAGLVWSDISSARVSNNLRGGAGALFLALTSGAIILFCAASLRLVSPALRRFATRGPSLRNYPTWLALLKWYSLGVWFTLSAITLLLLSFAQLWTFPALIPQVSNTFAWQQILDRPDALLTSLALGVACSVSGLILLLAWFETVPAKYDRSVLVISLLFLGLPSLLTGLGEYRLLLRLGLTATWPGLLLAHLLPATAYMFILLVGPYRSFDGKWRDAANGLMAPRFKFLSAIKWPLLKAPLAAAIAVGFAVAFAQYVPAQLVGAGRFDTLTIEAVTLSSGGNRPLLAAFALLLMVPPLLAFWLAAWLGRNKWSGV